MRNWKKGFLTSAIAALLACGAMRIMEAPSIPLFLSYVWLAISLVGAACEHFEFNAFGQASRAVTSIFALCLTFLIDALFGGVLLGGSWVQTAMLASGALLSLLAVYRFGKRRLRA
jgi:hypothetical protein